MKIATSFYGNNLIGSSRFVKLSVQDTPFRPPDSMRTPEEFVDFYEGYLTAMLPEEMVLEWIDKLVRSHCDQTIVICGHEKPNGYWSMRQVVGIYLEELCGRSEGYEWVGTINELAWEAEYAPKPKQLELL